MKGFNLSVIEFFDWSIVKPSKTDVKCVTLIYTIYTGWHIFTYAISNNFIIYKNQHLNTSILQLVMSYPISLYLPTTTIARYILQTLTALLILLILPIPLTLLINFHLPGTIEYEIGRNPIKTLIIKLQPIVRAIGITVKRSFKKIKCRIYDLTTTQQH